LGELEEALAANREDLAAINRGWRTSHMSHQLQGAFEEPED